MSFYFYSLWDWRFCFLLFLTSISIFASGIALDKKTNNYTFLNKSIRWWILFFTILLNLLILGYFKYADFFLTSLYKFLGHKETPLLNIMVPVGVSFYTFSAISYIVDVYQKKLKATNDFVACLAFVSFFPSILSGPIHKGTEQMPQFLKKRTIDYSQISYGFRSFLWGAFMKACVADSLGIYVDTVYSNISNHNGTTLLLASILYAFQIYADFAGYSLMAIGCGRMLGFELHRNFNIPYLSKTITEFWSKWHISLTSWFRNYLYFPLGGNRVSKVRWIFNILAVFILSGLWHGAAYTFIIWGTIHGLFQIAEKLFYGDRIKSIKNDNNFINAGRVLLTFSIVSVAWIFFRIPSLSDVFVIITKIISQPGKPFFSQVLVTGLISLLILVTSELIATYKSNCNLLINKSIVIRYFTIVVLIVYIMLMGNFGAGSFIYFQF